MPVIVNLSWGIGCKLHEQLRTTVLHCIKKPNAMRWVLIALKKVQLTLGELDATSSTTKTVLLAFLHS